jgi:hypothetical protein
MSAMEELRASMAAKFEAIFPISTSVSGAC